MVSHLLLIRSHFYNLTSFDAVVFHERDLNKNDLPKQRTPDQLYVHFNLEAPFHASIRGLFKRILQFSFMNLYLREVLQAFAGVTQFMQYFNISMSYREDADIRDAHRIIKRLNINCQQFLCIPT